MIQEITLPDITSLKSDWVIVQVLPGFDDLIFVSGNKISQRQSKNFISVKK